MKSRNLKMDRADTDINGFRFIFMCKSLCVYLNVYEGAKVRRGC